MARVSKERLISDVELQLTQGAPSQDLELEQSQIAFWLTQELNTLKSQEISQLLKAGKQVPPYYIVRQACNQLTEEVTDCIVDDNDGLNQRYYFALSNDVLDIDGDNGIVQVLTAELEEVYKGTIAMLPMLSQMRYTKPTGQLLIWSRQGDLIYVEGFLESDIDFNKIIVYYVQKQDLVAMADTDIVLISDKLLPVLIERVVEIGKLQVYGTTSDVTNNATQDQQQVYARAVQNPANIPTQQPE